jgi:glutamate formiminotransferase
MKIIECVPNFSEGRDPVKVRAIADTVRSSKGVRFLDVSWDQDHHRCVITFVGQEEDVIEGALAAAGKALEQIDLRGHGGVHPRIGAVDVVPFVPLGDALMDDAVRAAHRFGEGLATRFGVPVFFYGAAALHPERRDLSAIRRGGLEGLRARMERGDWRPDAGPSVCGDRGGATAVGARMPLIAFNIELRSSDLDLARRIARAIREADGGLPCVKALGLPLASRGIVQVSMNLTDYRQTSIRTVFDRVQALAREGGAEVLASELIGLAPAAALDDDTARYCVLKDFSARRIIENHL